ncbi:MAG: response regulator [Ignavibacteriaceae bacterium]|nr:response regulator [Ignavibacteriaceae bacterium]
MKLNIRIILINLAIVVMILGGGALAFYSIMFNIISSQQKRYLQNSANNLLITLDDLFLQTESALKIHLSSRNEFLPGKTALPPGLDFVGVIKDDSLFEPGTFIASPNVNTSFEKLSVAEFTQKNPYATILEYSSPGGPRYYYGVVLNRELLNYISIRVGAEISVYTPNKEVEFSNHTVNRQYLYIVNTAYNFLSQKSNFDIYSYQSGTDYLIATIYRIGHSVINAGDFTIIIFSTLKEAETLSSSVQNALVILAIAGVFLSIILTFVFTGRMRRQIDELNTATDIVKTGSFNARLDIESKDEIGDLAEAFNKMLNELDRQERMKNDYTDFISLINRNPDQKEIGETALEKIVRADNLLYAKVYLKWAAGSELVFSRGHAELSPVTESKKILDEIFKYGEEQSYPAFTSTGEVVSGKYRFRRYYVPVSYGGNTLAAVEIGSENELADEIKEHIRKIIAQLGIGLNNAQTLKILENLVTELKQLNEESHDQNQKILEQNEKLRELHSELTVKAEELSVQMKRAEEMTELKSRFLATISHELRTPLSTMLGLTELVVRSGSHDHKTTERLSVVLNSGKRLLFLINGILDLSKIEAGKMDVHNDLFSLEDIIEELKNTFLVNASERGIDFIVKNNFGGVTTLQTDRYKLLQILINLLGNAFKFTEAGLVELIIIPAKGNGIEFAVKDTGIGIAPEAQQIIFEEFRQVDSSSTRKHGGSGLGLTISEKFAELIGGRLHLSSSLNVGSVFTLTIPEIVVTANFAPVSFPAEDAEVNTRESPFYTANIKLPETGDYTSARKDIDILIVDDDPETLFTMNEIIRTAGFRTLLAKNGIECLEILEKKIPALVLMDIMMPRMDGMQAIRLIRADEKLKNLPVIALTARAMTEEREIINSAGFSSYVSKPVDTTALFQIINALISD